MSTPSSQDVGEISAQIAGLLDDFAQFGPEVADRAEVLVRLLVALHGQGLERLVRALDREPGGGALLQRIASDEIVAGLLVLHDLHPVDLPTRVATALDEVRPYLGSHAGGVTLLRIDDGVVHLRLEGSCDGCPASTITVKTAIEGAIATACPEVAAVEVEGITGDAEPEEAGNGLLQIQPLRPVANPTVVAGDLDWTEVAAFVSQPAGSVSCETVDGVAVLLCHLGDSLNAYRDACPSCAASLAAGTLTDEVLACGACDARFDVRRAGRPAGDHPHHLVPLPLLQRDDRHSIRIALPAGAT